MKIVQVEFKPGGKRYSYGVETDAEIVAGVDRVEIKNYEGVFVFPVLAVFDERPAELGDRKLSMVRKLLERA